MTHPPEPIPDLEFRAAVGLGCCPQCSGRVWFDTVRRPHGIWRCDHCRITWTPDGTGGQQT